MALGRKNRVEELGVRGFVQRKMDFLPFPYSWACWRLVTCDGTPVTMVMPLLTRREMKRGGGVVEWAERRHQANFKGFLMVVGETAAWRPESCLRLATSSAPMRSRQSPPPCPISSFCLTFFLSVSPMSVWTKKIHSFLRFF